MSNDAARAAPLLPIVTAPHHEGHCPPVEVQCGQAIKAFDTVARMESILRLFEVDPTVQLLPPKAVDTTAAIGRVHDHALTDFLAHAWERAPRPVGEADFIFADTFANHGLEAPHAEALPPVESGAAFGRYALDTITGIGPGTWPAAVGSVASAVTAAELVLEGAPMAVALCRPPGHHVGRTVFGGGCYLNNAAITAQLIRDRGAATVAVIDVDFHHGNGTQGIFYDRADVIYASLHGHPDRCYPYFTGHADEVGTGAGRGATINLPLESETTGKQYLSNLEHAVTDVTALRPDVVVVSLGFDTYRDDLSGDALLETSDYEKVGRMIADMGTPIVVLLEGGYVISSLGDNLRSWLTGASSVSPATPR